MTISDVTKHLMSSAEGLSEGESLHDILYQPDFDSAKTTCDWRNYVDDDVLVVWEYLGLEARLVAYLQAKNLANAEEWE